MDVVKFKIQSSWFGLRQRLMMQVFPDPLTGEPEPYWIEASQHNLNLVANRLQRLQEENKTLARQARERARKDRENPRRTLPLTLKELTVSVMDAVDRALSTNPILRATHDKLFPLAAGRAEVDGQAAATAITQLKTRVVDPEQASPYKPWLFPQGVCTGGFVPFKEPGLVGEHTEDHHFPASRLKLRVDPASRLKARLTGFDLAQGKDETVKVEINPNAPSSPVLNVTIVGDQEPSELAKNIAQQIRESSRGELGSPPKD